MHYRGRGRWRALGTEVFLTGYSSWPINDHSAKASNNEIQITFSNISVDTRVGIVGGGG